MKYKLSHWTYHLWNTYFLLHELTKSLVCNRGGYPMLCKQWLFDNRLDTFNGSLSRRCNARGSALGEEDWLHLQQSSMDRYVYVVQGTILITTWQRFSEKSL